MEELISICYFSVDTKVPSIPANETVTLQMYLGNPGASATSNGSTVFELFDDFEGTSLDWSKWVVTNTDGTYSISDSILDMSETSGRNEVIACNEGWSAPTIMRYKSHTTRTGSYYDTSVGFHYTNGIISGWAGAKGNAFIHSGGIHVEAGDGTNYTVRTLNISDAWHTFEIRRTGSVTEFYTDDTYQTTLDYDVAGIRYPRFFARNTHLKIDWSLIRKYASSEPTVTIAS